MNAISNLRVALVAGLVSVLGVGVWGFAAEEVELTIDQVPPAVKETILREAAGAEVTEIERETEGDVTVYEAEFTRDGQEIEVRIAPDGSVLGREVEAVRRSENNLTIEQMPLPVRGALHKMAGNAAFSELESTTTGRITIFEAEWQVNGVTHEVAMAADGTVLETEETIAAAAAPPSVQALIAERFGADAEVVVEKKTITLYEIEGTIDGKGREMLVSGAGHIYRSSAGDDDDDDDGEDEDDDDEDDEDEDGQEGEGDDD